MLSNGLFKSHTDENNHIMTSSISGGNALLPMSKVIKDNIYFNKVLSKVSFDGSTTVNRIY
ncbi:MAG: hypothetical protein MRQ07_05310 [Candidatus Midichloria sp.]|nr:hypothetical protein [Candidatus Midichloria sp.]